MKQAASIGFDQVATLPNVQNVANGARFVVSVPTGVKSIEQIGLELGGTFTSAMISNLEVLANGKPIQSFAEASHMELIQDYYGDNTPADRVVLNFGRNHFKDRADRERFFVGAGDLATLQVQGNVAGATGPTLTAYERKTILRRGGDKPQDIRGRNNLGLFTKVKNFTYTLTGAGTTEIDNIPREAWAQAIHLIQSADVITAVEVVIDGVKIWDASKARMTNIVQDAGRIKQASVYHIDWMLSNELNSQLPLAGVQDFRLKVSHSAGATVNAYVEYLSTFAGI